MNPLIIKRTNRFQPVFLYVTPAITVVLLLVFYIILSTSFLLQPGIKVDVPKSSFILSPQRNPQVVSILGAPHPTIYFENEAISLSELREKLSLQAPQSMTIVIKASKTAPFDLVTAVMNIALEANLPVVFATEP